MTEREGQMTGFTSRLLAEGKAKWPPRSKGRGQGRDVAQSGPWQYMVKSAELSTSSVLWQAGPVPSTAPPIGSWKNTSSYSIAVPG